MRLVRVVFALAAMAAAATGQSSAGGSKGAGAPSAAHVLWFSGEASQGLEQDGRGNLLAAGQRLELRRSIKGLYAAAYYPAVGVLVTVDGKAVARLYERAGEELALAETRPPREPESARRGGKGGLPISPVSARLCSIPGLVYLTWSHPKTKTPAQRNGTFPERIALGARARGWHAVTPPDPKVIFLEYVYQVSSGKVVHLSGPDGERIRVRLPDQLSTDTHHTPPYVEDEPVSVVPGRAIICRTRGGWSLHDANGKLIRYFPYGRAGNRDWYGPIYRHGVLYVVQRRPYQRGSYYRMDVKAGTLIPYAGRELPQ